MRYISYAYNTHQYVLADFILRINATTLQPACAYVSLHFMASNTTNYRRFNKLDRRYKQPVRTDFYEEHLDAMNALIEKTGLTVAEILRRAILIVQPEAIRHYESIRNEARSEPWTCACDKVCYEDSCSQCGLNKFNIASPEFKGMEWYKANMAKLKAEGKWNLQ